MNLIDIRNIYNRENGQISLRVTIPRLATKDKTPLPTHFDIISDCCPI